MLQVSIQRAHDRPLNLEVLGPWFMVACMKALDSHNWNDRLRFAARGLCCESDDTQYRATCERSRSMKESKVCWLDVHAETIAVSGCRAGWRSEIARCNSESGGVDSELVKKLGRWRNCSSVMKRGPTGYSCTGSWGAGSDVRSGSANASADEIGRSCEQLGATR